MVYNGLFIDKAENRMDGQDLIYTLNDKWPKKLVLSPERKWVIPYIKIDVFKNFKFNGKGFKS